MAEEKDTAAPAKRTAGKTGRRKKPEAEHAARAAPQDKDTGSKAQELLEQARTEPKPEWEVAEQVVLLPLDRLRPFKNHPFKVNDEDELMQDTIDSIMAGGVINPILVRPAEDGKFEVVSGHRRFRASELAGKADIKAIVREIQYDTNEKGNSVRKQLEIDFVCNKGSKRYYIQSAYAIPDQAKMEQEQRSLMLTGDFFKRIIITKDTPAPYYNENGVLIMSVYDFLLNENSLDI